MIDIEGFLAEYEALCKKYKIVVGSFGVFNTTGLGIVEKDSKIDDHIKHLRKEMNLGTKSK